MPENKPDLFVSIMAGGSGTRLWPLSREAHPKQLLPLAGDKPLIEETVRRVLPMVDPEQILIITTEQHAEATREVLPMLPEENIIAEPEGRDSAPCVGFAAKLVERVNPEAVIMSLSADHVIDPASAFRRNARAAAAAARESDCLVTIGIKPERPETRFGYIERGEKLSRHYGQDVFRVRQFKEKPDEAQAKRFLRSGRFCWNAGIFFWRAEVILELSQNYLPDHYHKLETTGDTLSTRREKKVLREVNPTFDKISIDNGIMKHAEDVRMVESTFLWDDVGGFPALVRYSRQVDRDNAGQGDVIVHDSRDNLIISHDEHTVAVVGVEGLVVVHTDDVTLVVPKDRAGDIKELVNRLRAGRKELT